MHLSTYQQLMQRALLSFQFFCVLMESEVFHKTGNSSGAQRLLRAWLHCFAGDCLAVHLHRCLHHLERNTSPGDCGLPEDNLHCSLDADVSIRGVRLHRSSHNSVHVSSLVKTDIMRCSNQGAPSATGVLLITERGAQRYALFINLGAIEAAELVT